MEINGIYQLTVTDVNEDGAGFGRIDGMAVFVPGLLEGETAEIRIVSAEKNYALGECIRRLKDSPDRITPVCPSYTLCGGCAETGDFGSVASWKSLTDYDIGDVCAAALEETGTLRTTGSNRAKQ